VIRYARPTESILATKTLIFLVAERSRWQGMQNRGKHSYHQDTYILGCLMKQVVRYAEMGDNILTTKTLIFLVA